MCYVLIGIEKTNEKTRSRGIYCFDFFLLLKMVTNSLLCYVIALLLMCQSVLSVELTFDLPDSARDCFHEHIKKNTSVVLEYQVKK